MRVLSDQLKRRNSDCFKATTWYTEKIIKGRISNLEQISGLAGWFKRGCDQWSRICTFVKYVPRVCHWPTNLAATLIVQLKRNDIIQITVKLCFFNENKWVLHFTLQFFIILIKRIFRVISFHWKPQCKYSISARFDKLSKLQQLFANLPFEPILHN